MVDNDHCSSLIWRLSTCDEDEDVEDGEEKGGRGRLDDLGFKRVKTDCWMLSTTWAMVVVASVPSIVLPTADPSVS